MDAFELKRMFIGDGDSWLLLEVAVRTIILYTYAILIVRLLGKRGLSNLSPFEYVIVFAAGTATGEPMAGKKDDHRAYTHLWPFT